MKKRNYLVLGLLLLGEILLSSCVSNEIIHFNPEELGNSNKSIVFFDVVEQQSGKWLTLPYELVRLDPEKMTFYSIFNNSSVSHKNIKSYGSNLLYLEPGIYYIGCASLLNYGDLKVNLVGPGCENGIIKYAAFEVKPREVISLGRLICFYNYRAYYRYENDFDDVKKQLQARGKFDLANRLKEGILFEAGSVIDKDEKGKLFLTTRKEFLEKQKKLSGEQK
ncbi:MAG: hypothetical protein C0412_06850 [Flavobacterium sp.]|nr:hypothetical protein [Flavobacterium sp.]